MPQPVPNNGRCHRWLISYSTNLASALTTGESVRRMERAFGRRPVAKMSEYLNAYRVDDSRDGTTITIGHRSQRMRRG